MKVLEFYYKIFVSPPPLSSVGEYFQTVLLLLIPWVLLLWMIAFVQQALTRPAAGDAVEWADTSTRVRFAWAWAGIVLSTLIVVDISVVWYLHRIPEWSAVVPHFTLIFAGLLVAFLECHALSGGWRRMQNHLREAR